MTRWIRFALLLTGCVALLGGVSMAVGITGAPELGFTPGATTGTQPDQLGTPAPYGESTTDSLATQGTPQNLLRAIVPDAPKSSVVAADIDPSPPSGYSADGSGVWASITVTAPADGPGLVRAILSADLLAGTLRERIGRADGGLLGYSTFRATGADAPVLLADRAIPNLPLNQTFDSANRSQQQLAADIQAAAKTDDLTISSIEWARGIDPVPLIVADTTATLTTAQLAQFAADLAGGRSGFEASYVEIDEGGTPVFAQEGSGRVGDGTTWIGGASNSNQLPAG